MALYPATTINGVPVVLGNGGENSGSVVAANLGATGPTAGASPFAAAGFMISYLSTGDAATAIGLGAKEMKYHGNTYSAAAVQEGCYTVWGYAHMFTRMGPASGNTGTTVLAKSFCDAVASNIYTTTATIKIPAMNVSRGSDGGCITALYF